MNSNLRCTVVGMALVVALASPAGAQFPQCLGNIDELVIVEPLNAQVFRFQTPGGGIGAQVAMAVPPVDCDLSPAGCYEFVVLPVTYENGPTSPTIHEVGSNDAPITGTIEVQVSPFLSTDPASTAGPTPSGSWDGASTAKVNVDPSLDENLATQLRDGAKVQIPADVVRSAFPPDLSDSSFGLGLLQAFHTPSSPDSLDCGQYNVIKRNLAGNQAAAHAMEGAPTPIVLLRNNSTDDTEVLPVEALNTTFFGTGNIGGTGIHTGAQTVMVANPVPRPAEICGGLPGDTTCIDCYELTTTYVSYDQTGKQILHLPTFPDPAVPDDIEAPIEGTLRTEILPISSQTLLTQFQAPFAIWDPDLTSDVDCDPTRPGSTENAPTNSRQVFLYTMRNGQLNTTTTYTLPTLRIPADAVQAIVPPSAGAQGFVLANVTSRHTPPTGAIEEFGFFSPFKRAVVWNQTLGNIHDGLATPIVFTKNSQTPDDEEVILFEPLDLALVTFDGIGAQLPVAECRNVDGEDVFRFGITYVTYDIGQVQVHQKDGTFPIEGSFEVQILSDIVNGPVASGEWDGSSTASLIADVTADQNLGVRLFRKSAEVLIPKDEVVSSLPALPGASGLMVATARGVHLNGEIVDASGFYNAIKRNFVHTQSIGNSLDQLPTPFLIQASEDCEPVE